MELRRVYPGRTQRLVRFPTRWLRRWLTAVLVASVLGFSLPVSAGGLDSVPTHACVAPTRPASGGPVHVELEEVVDNTGANQVLAMAVHPSNPSIYFSASRWGPVYRINGTDDPVEVMSVSPYSASEGGLLGIALHPDFANNGQLYLNYTRTGGAFLIQTVVSRFTSADGGLSFGPEEIVLTVDQPTTIHNAGDIHFGTDGFLYIALGDGGQQSSSQDTSDLLGSILRIDVDSGSPYAIPPSNPFAAGGGAPEVYAWGLRNPYRWGFDPTTGDLWVGDVGQALEEEVNLVTLGGNYGWPIYEGNGCYSGDCTTPGLTAPVVTYTHTQGCAIIGGRVYRGSSVPELEGAYIYADYCSREIWAAIPDGMGAYEQALLTTAPDFMAGFAQSADGDVLVLIRDGAYRLVPNEDPIVPFPVKLSDTGCVDVLDPESAGPGMIPFDVNMPLYSDGAEKVRSLAVPPGSTISIDASSGDFELPIGTVSVKTFFLEDEPVETRLFLRHDDGGWGGYSYEWDADGLDATLLETGKSKVVGSQTWTYPSRQQCNQCHTFAAGYSLGLETAQLNRDVFYPTTGRTANQLETLDDIGLLSPGLTAEPGLLDRLHDDTLNDEARGYLHANCSHCHRPSGGSGVGIDLRYSASQASLRLCELFPNAGTLGIPGARNLKLNSTALSILSVRTHLVGTNQMPPLARSLVDLEGTATLDAWILSWIDCAVGPDSDGDGVADVIDNCPSTANPTQADSDFNGVGDLCQTICNDKIDNDGDGLADYPADPGCASAASVDESPSCDDGADNDDDGNSDSPLDLGCQGAHDTMELSTCEDGVDNDFDGFADWAGALGLDPDPACAARPYNVEPGTPVPQVPSMSWPALIFLLGAALAIGASVARRRRPN